MASISLLFGRLIRLFFPSWRFFDELGAAPLLQYRIKEKTSEFGDWKVGVPSSPYAFGKLFLNPAGNLRNACNTMLERFVAELTKSEPDSSVESSVSYRLVEELLRAQLRENVGAIFQFRILIRTTSAALPTEAVIISSEHVV